MNSIRILVVDDHPIIGEGLEFLLNQDPGLLVLGTADNGRRGLELLRKLNPDVAILDLSMPQLDGFEAIRLFLGASPRLRIVIFSAHNEDQFVYRALRAGAQGYVIKGSPLEDLKQAIRYVAAGGYWVSPQFSRGIVEGFINRASPNEGQKNPFDRLSDREQQVFRLMAAGKETEEIGELLAISVSTVAKHRISLMKKLDLKNSFELIRFGLRHGLIEV